MYHINIYCTYNTSLSFSHTHIHAIYKQIIFFSNGNSETAYVSLTIPDQINSTFGMYGICDGNSVLYMLFILQQIIQDLINYIIYKIYF